MIRLFVMGGPYMFLLTALAVVILVLTVRKSIDLFARRELEQERLARGLNAILFWGSISAVLGLLGQFTASYLSLMDIMRGEGINPSLLAEGIAVSLITTIYGLLILAVSAVVWFGLRARLHSLTSRRKHAVGV